MIAKEFNEKEVPSVDTLKIPDFAGAQVVSKRYQRRTRIQYLLISATGLASFYLASSNSIRVLGLGLLFPGAGFLAVGGIGGAFGFLVSLSMLPLSLFAWFGAGGLGFVIANWLIPAAIASVVVGSSVWEPSAPIAVLLASSLISYTLIKARARGASALKLRDSRNAMLEIADVEWRGRADVEEDGDSLQPREMSHRDLKLLQRFIEMINQKDGDWTNFDVIDQFQTSALRYQLYNIQYTLAMVQKYYTPSFRGYIKSAQERAIERSTTKDIMNYWMWESLWGKFTLNWDPVVRDNIMVTGYLLLCLALYEKLNDDSRYSKQGAIKFHVTNRKVYQHSTTSIYEALMANWKSCSYCLFPCEPNWIYSACNLIGMEGALAYESYMQKGEVPALLQSAYHRNFEQEFMNQDGSIVALRSAITGFALPGIAGVLGDVGGALNCTASMPNLARRLWHVSCESNVTKNETTGKRTLKNLVGADKLDLGKYEASEAFAFAVFAGCAGEFGESDLQKDLLEELDTELAPIKVANPATGSLKPGELSTLCSGYLFRSRLGRRGDWARLINSPPDSKVRKAPKLDDVPFPAVLVATCHPDDDGTGLVFVLIADGGNHDISFTDLQPSLKYVLKQAAGMTATELVSDSKGQSTVRVGIDGRCEFRLTRTEEKGKLGFVRVI